MKNKSLVRVTPPTAQRLNELVIIISLALLALIILLTLSALTAKPAWKQQSKFTELPVVSAAYPAPDFINQLPNYTNAEAINQLLNIQQSAATTWFAWLQQQLAVLKSRQIEIDNLQNSSEGSKQ